MGLFQKKILPIASPVYSLGHQETLLIVGLGNIGSGYESTRHNMGFTCVDTFAAREEFNPWVEKKDLKSILCAKLINGKKIIVCKPTTFMNASGEALQLVTSFYKIDPLKVCVVYDELDLNFGTLKTVRGGSDAGHNGIKSLKKHMKDDFWRIRIGIGPKKPQQMDTADFVLQKFSEYEEVHIPVITQEATNLIHDWLSGNAKAETRTVLLQ